MSQLQTQQDQGQEPTATVPYWTEEQVTRALDTMKRGGLILVKGDIGYGLFGTTEAAIRKMYELKGRPFTNPCIFIGNLDVLNEIASIEDPRIRRWIERTASWTTCAVVLPERKESRLTRALPPWVYQQSVTNGTLAVFLNTGPFIDVMVRRAFAEGYCFVGSSANPSFTGNVFDFAEIPRGFVEAVDYYVDHGRSALANEKRLATTIINFTNWSIRRRGVNADRIIASFEELKRELGVTTEA